MEHLGQKLDLGRLVGVVLAELQLQLEGSSFPCRVVGAGERARRRETRRRTRGDECAAGVHVPEDHSVPHHDVVLAWGATDAFRRVSL